MTPCVCGHQHLDEIVGAVIQGGCTECTCLLYEPDDGTDSHLGNVVTEPYHGRYEGKCGLP